METQQGPPPIPHPPPVVPTPTSKPVFPDAWIGVGWFVICLLVAGLCFSVFSISHRGWTTAATILGGLFILFCFSGLLVASLRSKRPGLIIGFSFTLVVAVFLIIVAVGIMLLSECFGGFSH